MTICKVGGKDVSLSAFRYAVSYHRDPRLPEWWKRGFFADERKEIGVGDDSVTTGCNKGA